jgi:DNA-binding SARP family transcriptional activator
LIGPTSERSIPVREAAECHPLHEALWGRLILALAATGGQAAALSAYAGIRHRLREDLGVHPGPELMAFHQRVLRQEWTHNSARNPF